MLNLVRKHADSWLIKSILWMIVLAFVATIFYSWGMGGATGSQRGVVATVNGEIIGFQEYDRTFNNLVNFYREQFKNQFSDDLIQRLDLKTAAIDALIQKKLLLRMAEELNIGVSDEELIARIKGFPAFQKDNKFDPALYKNFLRFRRMTPLEFEESQRESLTIDKVEALIKANTPVSMNEILEAFRKDEEKLKIDYLAFPEDYFHSPQPATDGEITSYYDKHKKSFETPRQIKVAYVKLIPGNYEGEIEPTDEDIKDYYETNLGRFRVQKKYKASHILIRVEPSPIETGEKEDETKSADEDSAAKTKAEDLLKKIREGADFAEIAKKYSDDKVSGEKGGSLGEFPRGSMVAPFEKALNKLKVGEISEPVRTPFGYHIIKLEDKIEEHVQPLTEVRDQIIQALKKVKAKQKVRRILKRVHRSAQTDGNLERAAKEHNVEVKTTDFFSREKHDLPEIGMVPEFFNAAFTLSQGKVSSPVHGFAASFILKPIEERPPEIPKLEDIRKQVEKAVMDEKDKAYTTQKMKEYREQLSREGGLEKIAESLQQKVQTTPFFSQIDSIPGIGDIKTIKDKVFGLKKGQTTYASARGKHYLIQIKERQEPGEPDEDQIRAVRERLQAAKANQVYQEWLQNIRAKADIMIDKTLL